MGFALLESKVKRIIRRIGRADNEIGGRMLLRGFEFVEGQRIARSKDGTLQLGEKMVKGLSDRQLAEKLIQRVGQNPDLVGLEAGDGWEERIERALEQVWKKGPHYRNRSKETVDRQVAALEADRRGEEPEVDRSR